KSLIMLLRQNGVWYRYRYLFAIANGFESCPDGHFCFPEANVAAYEAIHWVGLFHIPFNILCGLTLVWRIFIDKRCFQLYLKVVVGGKGKARLRLSGCIQFD